MKFAIFGNSYQTRKSENIAMLFATLERRGDTIAIDRPFYEFLASNNLHNIENAEIIDSNDFSADFVISYGGDGTLLRTASRVMKITPCSVSW